jgi:hypothetical protein
LEHTRANPDIETILCPKISQLEHTVVSQEEFIASLTQELSDLKERYKVLETKARVPEDFPGRVPNLSSETGGEGVLPDAEWMRLSAESVSACQEVERLSRELSSLRDEKLTLVADLNSAVLAKEALVIEKARLVTERDAALAERDTALVAKDTALAERDTALAEKDRALSDKGRILAEKDEVSLALGKAVSKRDLAEADKDQVVAERESTLEKLEGIEGRYQRIRRKYRHYKARVRRLSEQLSFIPWLWTKAWAFDFHIGFENFRALVLRSDRLQVSFENVSSNFLLLPSSCYSELLDLGIEYFPEIFDWSKDAPNPKDASDRKHGRDDDPENNQPGGE